MSKTVLITRPYYDDTTHYLYHWSSLPIILASKRKDIKIVQLVEDKVNKKNFESITSKIAPSFIFMNGHGSDSVIAGHNSEYLVEVGVNEAVFDSRIIYALSCSSGKLLGPASIKAGARAYVGYDDVFVFYTDLASVSKAMFLEPSNTVVNALLKGHTVSDAHNRSQKEFMKNIQTLLTMSSDTYLVPWLLWDMRHQVCLGDKTSALQ